MIKPTYHRQSRTLSSEQYQIMEADQRIGHLDLHFGANEVFATLVLDRELTEDATAELIDQIDDDLVLSADVPREDFYVTIYVGREIGLHSDELLSDDFVGNGHEGFDDA